MIYVRLLFLLGLISFSLLSFGQSSYIQLIPGYAPLSSVNFGGTIGIEKNLKATNQLTIGLNYNGYDLKTQGIC